MRRLLAVSVVAVVAVVVFAGCSSGPAQTRPPDAVYVSATGIVFQQAQVEAPANRPFQLYFENFETVPHNVNVADGTGASVARGEVFTGPSGQTLQMPALAAGTYKLLCDVHPEMRAELVAN